MDNNGKINRGMDLGTTNSAIAVMEHGVPVIIKSSTQKDTVPSIVSVNRKRVIHVGDTAANELASQVLRATKAWSGDKMTSDIFKEFKRTMGSLVTYHSKVLKKDFTSQELSAEIIKALSANAGANDGGSIVISVPAKFDATQKTATVEAARLAGFSHVELIQEPIAAAVAYGMTTGQNNGFWLVFDFGGGTFDAALLRVEGGVQQVVDTEGDSFLGGKDIDYALVDQLILPHLKNHFKLDAVCTSDKKLGLLREALKIYAEKAKVDLSTAASAEILSDLGDLGCDDEGNEIEIDMTITREMAHPVMEPFFTRTTEICLKLMKRNRLQGSQLTKVILVGGPTFSPYLRQMLKDEVSPNVDTSVDPMTAVAKGAALYAATRDIPEHLKAVAESGTLPVELHYESMATGLNAFIAVKVKDGAAAPSGMTVQLVRNDGAWRSGLIPYETGGTIVEVVLAEHTVNNFTVRFQDARGRLVKISTDNLTIIQGMQVSAAPLPYHIGFGVWDPDMKRQAYVPFTGLEKNLPLPAMGTAFGRKTTMTLVPGREDTILKIPVYQADEYTPFSPATLYEHVADVLINGKDVAHEVPAGSEVTVQVEADSSEMMKFTVTIPGVDEVVVKQLDTSPHFDDDGTDELIEGYIKSGIQSLKRLSDDGINVQALKTRLLALRHHRSYMEKKALDKKYKELLQDIYQLESDTAWERIIRKVEKRMAGLAIKNADRNQAALMASLSYINDCIESAKANKDVDAAKKILQEIEDFKDLLAWRTMIPAAVRWYDRNFDDLEWTNEERAKQRIEEALEVVNDDFTMEEGYYVLRRIRSLRKNTEYVREAEGLLG